MRKRAIKNSGDSVFVVQPKSSPETPVPQENILSLRPRVWKFEFNPTKIKSFFIHHVHPLIVMSVVFLSLIILTVSFQTRANVAILYPASCLGGWENAKAAQGEPEIKDHSDSTLFNQQNSATLKNSNEEMFCGDFRGTIPTESEPKKITVTFHWSFDYGDEDSETSQDLNEEFGANEEIPQENSPEETKEETLEEPEEIPPSLEEKEEEEIQKNDTEEIKETPEGQATSFLRKIFSIAYAQEEPSPEPEPAPEPEPEPQPDPEPEVTSESDPEPGTEEDLGATEETPVTTEEDNNTDEPTETDSGAVDDNENQGGGGGGGSSSSNEDPIEEDESSGGISEENKEKDEEGNDEKVIEISPNDIFEVVYTLDGETWEVLGRVRKDKWQDSTFEIPYEKINSWEDLSKLQIRLKTLPSFDFMPVIYLDAISLSVEYDDVDAIIETLDFENIVHVVDSPDAFVFLAKKENKYGIWVLDKSLIGTPEEGLHQLETVGVLPYEPIVKDGIIFWLVGDPQTPLSDISENIIPVVSGGDVPEENNNEIPPTDSSDQSTSESSNLQVLEVVVPDSATEEENTTEEVLVNEDELLITTDQDSVITEVTEGQTPTAIVGFREDIGYISQTILDTSNKDNWLNFESYAVAWKDGAFLIFDNINSVALVFDSIVLNKNIKGSLPKTRKVLITNIPDFPKEKEDTLLEIIDATETTLFTEETNNSSEEIITPIEPEKIQELVDTPKEEVETESATSGNNNPEENNVLESNNEPPLI